MCSKDVLKMKQVQRITTKIVEEDLNQWGVQPGKTKVADVQMIVSSADIREGKKADIEKKKLKI